MTQEELQRLRNWAHAKIEANQDLMWVWYQYMKLREALDAIIAGMECVAIQTESSPLSWEHPESGPKLVVSNAWPDARPNHSKANGSLPDSEDATASLIKASLSY
jgi:hypothetical protein